MVGALLASEGYEVREAPDGARGVALAMESEPDIALVDLMMPGEMDGMAVLAALRERAPEIPVVMMSGRAGLSDAVRATQRGAFNFLQKPAPRGGRPAGPRIGSRASAGARRSARPARRSRARRRDDWLQPSPSTGA